MLPQDTMGSTCSNIKGNIPMYVTITLKLFPDFGMHIHINEEPNMFGLQRYLIQPDYLNMFSSLCLFIEVPS
jgi:hypothetical protein